MLVAIYNRTFDKQDIPVMLHIIKLLDDNKLQLIFYKGFYERLQPLYTSIGTPRFFTNKNDLPKNTDMLFSLGGDGTMLDAITFVGNTGIPLIGINLGKVQSSRW
jgi:NAD+ kinase